MSTKGTVESVMLEHHCLRLIHGHTHRPGIHDFTVDKQAAQRFVLAAWSNEAGNILCWDKKGHRIEII